MHRFGRVGLLLECRARATWPTQILTWCHNQWSRVGGNLNCQGSCPKVPKRSYKIWPPKQECGMWCPTSCWAQGISCTNVSHVSSQDVGEPTCPPRGFQDCHLFILWATWAIFPTCGNRNDVVKRDWVFFPALPGEYETWSVNYWNFE